jgi:maltose O-acetyltransferase
MPRSERDKMIAGELYSAADPELVAMRLHAREMVRRYNATTVEEADKRRRIMRDLLGKTGSSFEIEPPFACDYGTQIEIGDGFYANFGCVILDVAPVTFGDGVLLGPNVQVYAAYHPIDPAVRRSGLEAGAAIRVGDNVWIGGGAILNPGVSIGENSVIGSGSVVTKGIPSNVVAAGNPCRVLRQIQPGEKVSAP